MKNQKTDVEHTEERFRLLVDSVTDYAIFMLDTNGMITSWNKGAERLKLYSASEAIGQHFSIFYPREDRDGKPAQELETALEKGHYEEEGWRVRKDSSRFWANVVIAPIYDNQKKHLGFSKVTRDLTSRREAVERLRQSEERANLMIESVRDYAIFMLSPEGIIETWKAGAERLKGYSRQEIIGKHFSIFYPQEDLDNKKPARELEIATQTGRYEEEGWRLHKNGTRLWVNVVITAVFGNDGKLRGFSKVTRDLTVRREAEEKLRLSEERANLMIASVRDYAIFMLNPQGLIQTWNLGAERLKGYKPDEIIGKHFSIFYSDEERNTKPAMELQVATKEGRYEEEGWRYRKDGTRFWANVVITALFGRDGTLRGFSKVTRDMTERKKAEESRLRLEQERIARVEAEHANRIKDEFMAVVSHELRTPLMPIVGWSRMLQDQRMQPADQVRGLKIIERNANIQAKLIEDLLDISSIISGKVTLNSAPVGLAQIVEAALDAVRPVAQAKNIRLNFTLEESVGPIMGDALRLQQVLWNLLSNAVKFTPDFGSVEVRARRTEKCAQINVIDSGAGIAPDYLPHMFQRFSQFDSSSTRKHSGLGIGLFVVNQLVTLHGGRVYATSEGLGKGAMFTVEFPLPDTALSETAYPLDSIEVKGDTNLSGSTILVVDDEHDARDFLSFALRQCGAQVLVAASMREALEKIQSAKIDVLVSDIGMPEADGYELIRKMRGNGSDVPAIAVTAFARAEDAIRATDAGFQRHLTKPVNPVELCSTVAAVLKKRPA